MLDDKACLNYAPNKACELTKVVFHFLKQLKNRTVMARAKMVMAKVTDRQ
jgi:hypothetical protein